jgi:hypothetical protein
MPYVRRLSRRLIQGQGGSTLVELVVAMPLAILCLGVVVQGFATGTRRQQEVETRSETIQQAQFGLERMTRALRQATWVYFRSSQVVDLQTMVREAPGTPASPRLVRFDCSAGMCLRLEGPATTFPPPAQPAFESSRVILGADPQNPRDKTGWLQRLDIFTPRRIDPTTGVARIDYVSPHFVDIRVRLRPARTDKDIELVDGVALRNHGDNLS